MGHLGLTPQSVHAIGGFKVQGKQLEAARALVDDAGRARRGRLLRDRARVRARRRRPPRHRVGARCRRSASAPGRHCDGQVLVLHDLLGLEDRLTPKFVRRYASLKADATSARSLATPRTSGPGRSRRATRRTTSPTTSPTRSSSTGPLGRRRRLRLLRDRRRSHRSQRPRLLTADVTSRRDRRAARRPPYLAIGAVVVAVLLVGAVVAVRLLDDGGERVPGTLDATLTAQCAGGGAVRGADRGRAPPRRRVPAVLRSPTRSPSRRRACGASPTPGPTRGCCSCTRSRRWPRSRWRG